MVFFSFIQNLIEQYEANGRNPDQTLHSAASDMGLHCLPMSHKSDGFNKASDSKLFPVILHEKYPVKPRLMVPIFAGSLYICFQII